MGQPHAPHFQTRLPWSLNVSELLKVMKVSQPKNRDLARDGVSLVQGQYLR